MITPNLAGIFAPAYRQLPAAELVRRAAACRERLRASELCPRRCGVNRLADSAEIFHFLAREISPTTYINIMEQYRPCGQAFKLPPIDRSLDRDEYEKALELARAVSLQRVGEPTAERLLRWLFRG